MKKAENSLDHSASLHLRAEKKKCRHLDGGFKARLKYDSEDIEDLFNWECTVPGAKGTGWEDGSFTVRLAFPADYPESPPVCSFERGFYHYNVFPSGLICSRRVSEARAVADVLKAIQELLDTPDLNSFTRSNAWSDYHAWKDLYRDTVRC